MIELVAKLHRCVETGVLEPAILPELETSSAALQECEVLDFKQQLPSNELEYAKLVRDLLALHNSYGGFIVFGVSEIQKDRAFEIVGVTRSGINIAKLRDLARSYVGSDLRMSVSLGQRKQLLFDLWFEAEYGRGNLPGSMEVTTKAIEHEVGDAYRWYEKRAQVHIALAHRSKSRITMDAAVREVDLAIEDLRTAREMSNGDIQYRQMDILLGQAEQLKKRIAALH